ncbi:MAG TPA: hypothetical protein VN947_06275 [Polyangia bacterium]|nr:hypothetical protein [Polyangia bacterium]
MRLGAWLLRGLPDETVIGPPLFTHSGLSADGKRLALVVTVRDQTDPQVWIAELPSATWP